MLDIIALGGALKFDPDNPYKVSGELVLFSSASDPDLTGDFFTKDTDYRLDRVKSSPILYHHGLNPYVQKSVIGDVQLSVKDDMSVWVEGELDKRNKYVEGVVKLLKKGGLGWSSGTASHLVTTKAIENSDGVKIANEILTWPLGLDASLTPTPAEPRTFAKSFDGSTMPIKTYALSMKDILPSMADEFSADTGTTMPSKEPYSYSRDPKVGHAMASKMCCEHNSLLKQMYRSYAIGLNDYRTMNRHFGNGMARFTDSMNPQVAGRSVPAWDAGSMHWKSMGPMLGTVGDVYHAAMTRAYNAAADHLMTHGHINAGEHMEMRGLYDEHIKGAVEKFGPELKDRKLSECGDPELWLKAVSEGSDDDLGKVTFAVECKAALGAVDSAVRRLRGVNDRGTEIKTLRQAKGEDLGSGAVSRLKELSEHLSELQEALKGLLPQEDPDRLALIAALEASSVAIPAS